MGKSQVLKEMKQRRNKFQAIILARQTELLIAKKQIKIVQGKLVNLRERETGFRAGYAFRYHKISSEEELNQMLTNAEEELAHLHGLIDALTEEVKNLEKERGLGDKNMAGKIWRDLTHKYCYYEAEKVCM